MAMHTLIATPSTKQKFVYGYDREDDVYYWRVMIMLPPLGHMDDRWIPEWEATSSGEGDEGVLLKGIQEAVGFKAIPSSHLLNIMNGRPI